MYLAPLNYDRYFKKVFSETRIAKRFLEDFFDVEISEMELLPTKHKITDDATAVEFDFLCKIGDNFVIIDMQQWFKTDIVKRFYMYHSMNTVLQLEKMPDKSIDLEENKKRDIKDYDKLIPVITLIWLADDDLNFKDDFVSYMMTGEIVNDFIKNKKYSKYLKWFELAEKTRNTKNEQGWFDEYLEDQIFVEIIKRLNTETFGETYWEDITDYQTFRIIVERYAQVYIEKRIEKEKAREKEISQGEIIKARKIAKEMKDEGEPIERIIKYTKLSIEEIEKL